MATTISSSEKPCSDRLEDFGGCWLLDVPIDTAVISPKFYAARGA